MACGAFDGRISPVDIRRSFTLVFLQTQEGMEFVAHLALCVTLEKFRLLLLHRNMASIEMNGLPSKEEREREEKERERRER